MILYLENCAILMLPVDHIENDFRIFVAISHGKLDLSFFFMARPKEFMGLLHISEAEIAEENNQPQVLEKYVCLVAITSTSQKVGVAASKQVPRK